MLLSSKGLTCPQKGDAGGFFCSPRSWSLHSKAAGEGFLLWHWMVAFLQTKNSQNSGKIPWSVFYCISLLPSITEVKTELWRRNGRGNIIQLPWSPSLTAPHTSAEMSELEIWSSWNMRKAECSLAAFHSSILVQLCKGIYCNWASCQSWHTTPIESVMYCK